MGWRGFMRSVQASSRRAERAAVRRQRALIAEAKNLQAMQEEAIARHTVALYDNYLDTLTSLHKDCWNPWDWRVVAVEPPPPTPPYMATREHAARHALETYNPTLADKLVSAEALRRAELAAAVERARQEDHAAWQHACAEHRAAHERWAWFNGVARAVLAGDLEAYQAVVAHLSPFEELSHLGTTVQVSSEEPWYVLAELTVRDTEIVPDEVYAVTARGKLSTKAMPRGRFHELYQGHVASAALRIARELFALLPLAFAFVNVSALALNPSTGYLEPVVILSVAFERQATLNLNFDAVDPSSALSNFVHRMKFKKTSGFAPVEPLDVQELRPRSVPRA